MKHLHAELDLAIGVGLVSLYQCTDGHIFGKINNAVVFGSGERDDTLLAPLIDQGANKLEIAVTSDKTSF